MIFSILHLPTLAFCVLAQVTLSEKPHLIRYDYSAAREHLRTAMLRDEAHVEDWRRVVAVTLLSSGKRRFVKMDEVDLRDHRRIETIINDKKQRAEFRRDPGSNLTAAEREAGAGILTLGGRSIKLTPRAETASIRGEINAMLAAWDPHEREALEILYKKTLACGLHAGMGVLLPILFGDPPAGGCEAGMLEADPDPTWDRKFLTIAPELAEWLKTPAKLITNSGAPR
jgi:hypothetical protein